MSDIPPLFVDGFPLDALGYERDEGTQVAVKNLPFGEFVAFATLLTSTLVRDGRVWIVTVAHDDGCPGREDNSLATCSCEFLDAVFWRAPIEGRVT